MLSGVLYVNCISRIVLYMRMEYYLFYTYYCLSAQDVDERIISVHHHYYYSLCFALLLPSRFFTH